MTFLQLPLPAQTASTAHLSHRCKRLGLVHNGMQGSARYVKKFVLVWELRYSLCPPIMLILKIITLSFTAGQASRTLDKAHHNLAKAYPNTVANSARLIKLVIIGIRLCVGGSLG
jgi:hypothetical protein